MYTTVKSKLPYGYTIYNYEKSPLYVFYDSLFEFIINDIEENWKGFSISPCYFYFIESGLFNGKPVKAYACVDYDFKIIGISYKLIENLKDFIDKRLLATRIYKVFERTAITSSVNHFVHQCCILFIYYHELAHIIQNSEKHKQISENLVDDFDEGQILESHVMETDADHFAANMVLDRIIGYWRKVDSTDRNLANLEIIVSAVLAGIFITFDYLSSGIRPFYTLQTSHPHEVFRIIYINGIINTQLERANDINFNRSRTINNVFAILNECNCYDVIHKYLTALKFHGEELNEYTILVNDAGYKFPNLASFKMELRPAPGE